MASIDETVEDEVSSISHVEVACISQSQAQEVGSEVDSTNKNVIIRAALPYNSGTIQIADLDKQYEPNILNLTGCVSEGNFPSQIIPIVNNIEHNEDNVSDVTECVTEKNRGAFRQPLLDFTCPVCLSPRQVYFFNETDMNAVEGENESFDGDSGNMINTVHSVEQGELESTVQVTIKDNDEVAINFDGQNKIKYMNEFGFAVFQLSSCQHMFCTTCLRAYIRSQLLDGVHEITCCYTMATEATGKFDVCNVHLQESDILQLINFDNYIDDCSSGDANLLKKYKKLKFDKIHGKDTVRRCPKCDEPHLFHKATMREYQVCLSSKNKDSSSVETNNSQFLTAALNRRRGSIPQCAEEISNINKANDDEDISTIRNINPVSTKASTKGCLTSEIMPPIREDNNNCILNVSKIMAINENYLEHSPEQILSLSKETESTHHLSISTSPTVRCKSCDEEFCYFHSNAHPGQTCSFYNEKTLENDRLNLEFASDTLQSKPCPNCGILVSKEGGCNQIKCSSCNNHFCWLCLAIVDDGTFPQHYRWWNLNGCPNMQLIESNESNKCNRCGARTLSILQMLVLGIPALVLSLITICCCPCLFYGTGPTNRDRLMNCISFWGSCLSMFLLLPFTCLGLIILSVIYCFLASIIYIKKAFKCITGKKILADQTNINNTTPGQTRPATPKAVENITSANVSESSADDFISVVERILERMEEGRQENKL